MTLLGRPACCRLAWIVMAIGVFSPAVATGAPPERDASPAVAAPGLAPTSEPSGAAPRARVEDQEEAIRVDAILPTSRGARRFWQVEGLYELHYNLVSDEHSGSDWVSEYLVRGELNLTLHDQVAVRMDLEQRYVADPGESGLWPGDLRLYYARSFEIPIRGFVIPAKASAYLTVPTSRISQERGYITRPTAILTAAPTWGPLTLVGKGLFQYAFARWATSPTGDPNTQITTGFSLQLFYTVFDWFAPSVAWETYWNLDYRSRELEGQPVQPEYSFELALNFSVPMPARAPTLDVSLAYAQGADVLEDGVSRLYFTKRDQSEVYLALDLRY